MLRYNSRSVFSTVYYYYMNLSLRITGPAGMGFNSLGHAIGRLVSSMGYHVLGDIEYESRIKG